MIPARRMLVLEHQAETILLNKGYIPVIVSDHTRSSRYIPFNLMACKELDGNLIDSVMVKLKISLHALTTLDEVTVFCYDEIKGMKKYFDKVLPDTAFLRFEVWVSIPSNIFQQFEITREGICEILSPAKQPGHNGSAA